MTMASLLQDTPECDTRVGIYTCSISDYKEKINEVMNHVEGQKDLENNGCNPYFIFFRDGKPMRAFSGVCGPDIMECMTDNTPALKKTEEDELAQ